jgi:tetratricopeptide (TPR) repeat protein
MRARLSMLLRCGRRLAAGGLLLLAAACTHTARPEPVRHEAVRDPHYGEVLFYFYQQKYFSALGHLMAEQQFAHMPNHADEAELLRGGLVLSYGLHAEAGRIFERLIEAGARPAVRDRAWFYLAKIRYQRGYRDEALDALTRIGGRLPGELEDERIILHATLLMARQQYREATERLAGVGKRSSWARYGRYNLGVALVRAGESARGVALLEAIGRDPVDSEEHRALRDKANVALGFIYLQEGKPEPARDALERVRLKGLMSNKALLGIGWVYSTLDQQQRALVYWDELRLRDVQDASVLESLLAVPYALGKLGVWRQSLARYEEAIAAYTREMAVLDTSIAAIRSGKLGESLLTSDADEEMGWFWRLERLPDTPETRYLTLLMAGHDFQEALKNYRDLQFMETQLTRWTADVGAYRDMLATRRAAFNQRLPAVLDAPRMRDRAQLMAARDQFAGQLARIEQEQDGMELVRDKERAQLERLERIRGQLSRHAGDDESQERYRVLRGLLRWDVETDFSARLWETQKSLREVDRQLAENETRRTAFARARIETPRTFDAFDVRIDGLSPRIHTLHERARQLVQAQGEHLAELAIAELEAQRGRLEAYLTQARFAVAQIYDQSAGQPPETP